MLERQREVVEEAADDGGESGRDGAQRRSSVTSLRVDKTQGQLPFGARSRTNKASHERPSADTPIHPKTFHKHIIIAHYQQDLLITAPCFLEASRDQQTGNTSLFLHPLSTDCSNLAWLHISLKVLRNWKSYKRFFLVVLLLNTGL